MNKPRGYCIFCGGGNLTKEHFYPDWMAPLLPPSAGYGEQIGSVHPERRAQVSRDAKRPASIATKKMRVVCGECNSGWMNRLEAKARPHLTRMIQGKRFMLTPDEQSSVAKWAVMKAMTAEVGIAMDPMTHPDDRSAMRDRQDIPWYYRVYAGSHSLGQKLGYLRKCSVFGNPLTGPIPVLDGMRRNVQQATILLGHAFIHINAARLEGFYIEDLVEIPLVHKHMRLWPLTGDRRKWPGKAVLNASQVRDLANSWEIAVQKAGWAGNVPRDWIG